MFGLICNMADSGQNVITNAKCHNSGTELSKNQQKTISFSQILQYKVLLQAYYYHTLLYKRKIERVGIHETL